MICFKWGYWERQTNCEQTKKMAITYYQGQLLLFVVNEEVQEMLENVQESQTESK